MPRRARISREQIVAAAIGLADREGIGALTMAKVGAELGVEAMSLYNHFPNKGALLDGIAEALVAGIGMPEGHEDWEDFLKEALRSVRRLAREHPGLFPLVLDRAPDLLAEARLIEAYLGLQREAGFSGEQAMVAFQVLSSFAIGYALSEIRGFALQPGRSRLSARELPPGEFPEIQAMASYFESVDRTAEFEAGLDLVLAGLKADRDERNRSWFSN
ncbi:MAG: TetR/AcrR family transcriptional regulator C-terminal domain-containing protein [Actinobacteria bacterium]|nr:TetR/AcrR family transcriptional regulator C-terminal domain-containing protein [Actinomycetota bacterium]